MNVNHHTCSSYLYTRIATRFLLFVICSIYPLLICYIIVDKPIQQNYQSQHNVSKGHKFDLEIPVYSHPVADNCTVYQLSNVLDLIENSPMLNCTILNNRSVEVSVFDTSVLQEDGQLIELHLANTIDENFGNYSVEVYNTYSSANISFEINPQGKICFHVFDNSTRKHTFLSFIMLLFFYNICIVRSCLS